MQVIHRFKIVAVPHNVVATKPLKMCARSACVCTWAYIIRANLHRYWICSSWGSSTSSNRNNSTCAADTHIRSHDRTVFDSAARFHLSDACRTLNDIINLQFHALARNTHIQVVITWASHSHSNLDWASSSILPSSNLVAQNLNEKKRTVERHSKLRFLQRINWKLESKQNESKMDFWKEMRKQLKQSPCSMSVFFCTNDWKFNLMHGVV